MIRHEVAIGPDYPVPDELPVFDWCMIYTDRHPGVASHYPNAVGQRDRLLHLGAIPPLVSGPMTATVAGQDFDVVIWEHYWIANQVYQELAEDIRARRLEPKRRTYLDDRPDGLDPTLCVLDLGPILKIAKRRGDGGVIIKKLLIDHERNRQPGPKPGAQSIKGLACELALQILDDEARRPLRGRGRRTMLAGLVNVELTRLGHRYKDESVGKMIRESVREWEKKHPHK